MLVGAHLDSWDLATGDDRQRHGRDRRARSGAHSQSVGRPSAAHDPLRPVHRRGGGSLRIAGVRRAARAPSSTSSRPCSCSTTGPAASRGMSLQGHDELRDGWRAMLAPLRRASARSRFARATRAGPITSSFVPYGVPAFNYDQESRGYNHTHHSQVDTYDSRGDRAISRRRRRSWRSMRTSWR